MLLSKPRRTTVDEMTVDEMPIESSQVNRSQVHKTLMDRKPIDKAERVGGVVAVAAGAEAKQPTLCFSLTG